MKLCIVFDYAQFFDKIECALLFLLYVLTFAKTMVRLHQKEKVREVQYELYENCAGDS